MDYVYDLLYDIKTEEQLSQEVEYLVNRLGGIMQLRRDENKSIDDYIQTVLFNN